MGAWDVGLENVDEAAVRFLQLAVETHVRALLLKLVSGNAMCINYSRAPRLFDDD